VNNFISDNVAGAHPDILDALAACNEGLAPSYGNDDHTRALNEAFSTLFETDVVVVPCTTGTAANALSLSLIAGPINAICAHEQSHVYQDECNAPEFFTGGARLSPIGGADGKLDLDALRASLSRKGDYHAAQPSAVTFSQVTERGTVYSLQEIAELSEFSHANELKLHMDGARFSNAVASLNCSPAEMTWKAGVDLLSFGATKNGCMAAEAIILFNTDLEEEARYRAKRCGQLLSKMRFVTAQLLAFLDNDLWLKNALLANAAAAKLAEGLSESEHAEIANHPQANMLYAKIEDAKIAMLEEAGLAGYVDATGWMRLCTSWRTTDSEIQAFLECLRTARRQ
jgi:threonine aldolase